MDLKQKYTMESKINELLSIISNEYDTDIFSKSRDRDCVEARAIFSKILYTYHGMGYTKIARVLNKNHASIYHYIKNFDHWVKYDEKTKTKYLNILNVYSVGLDIREKDEVNKIWYENIVLSTKIEKLEAKLSSKLHAILDKVPKDKESLVYERLESIIHMNC